MNQRTLIKKTLRKRRGYSYHTYRTSFVEESESEEICVYHYGTLILRVDLVRGVPTFFRITSVSDRDMINVALRQIDTRNYMTASANCGIKESISENRFLRHGYDGTWLFDEGERVDREGSVLVVKNLHAGAAEAFETSTRRRKFWLKRDPEAEENPELYDREAKRPVDNADYIGSVAENEGLAPLVVGHTLKESTSTPCF